MSDGPCTLTIGDAQFQQLMAALKVDHSWLEASSWSAQIFLVIAACFAAFFAYRQVRAVHQFEILKYLQDPDLIAARREVRTTIVRSDRPDWWEDKRLEAAASTVCVSYDIVARMIRSGPANRFPLANSSLQLLLDIWSISIVATYQILEPFIAYRRKNNGDRYLEGYSWLYDKAVAYQKAWSKRSTDAAA